MCECKSYNGNFGKVDAVIVRVVLLLIGRGQNGGSHRRVHL